MDDARGDFLGPPHGTTPAAVIANNFMHIHVSLKETLSYSDPEVKHQAILRFPKREPIVTVASKILWLIVIYEVGNNWHVIARVVG